MSSHLTPLKVCERIFGDLAEVERAAGLRPKSAYRWRGGSAWRDAGDLPSARVMRKLLWLAQARGLPLRVEWLLFGAAAEEVDVAMAAADRRAA